MEFLREDHHAQHFQNRLHPLHPHQNDMFLENVHQVVEVLQIKTEIRIVAQGKFLVMYVKENLCAHLVETWIQYRIVAPYIFHNYTSIKYLLFFVIE